MLTTLGAAAHLLALALIWLLAIGPAAIIALGCLIWKTVVPSAKAGRRRRPLP